jgi:iron complex outermembrane receptor protein
LRYSNVHYESKDHYIIGLNGNDSGQTDYKNCSHQLLYLGNYSRTSTYISYAKGFETPTFTEMAYPTDGTAGINFALKPSTSDNYELGLKHKIVR